ncbi:MAG TPA: hypothetical protein PK620_16805, partial [Denitromonas sp.]|nr:hypothetical protein [Denitromonas sp.]HQV16570.1 hypothetical protein [Denitromonas sp.]
MTSPLALAPLSPGWCIAPPLVFALAATGMMASGANTPAFIAINQWTSALPDGVWAGVTDTASVLSA